jgi:hypothetical protein
MQMTRHWFVPYFAVWEDLPNRVVWFELGKDWANNLIKGNFFERLARRIVLSTINPLFATALEFVISVYRGKLNRHVGPNGIWVAVQIPVGGPPITRVFAKKRNESNMNTKGKMSHPPDPWEPPTWNVV